MTCRSPLTLAACLALAGVGSQVVAAEKSADGFMEGSTLSVLNRNFYFNRDNRDSVAPTHNPSKQPDNGYSEAWGHAVITRFESGAVLSTYCRLTATARHVTNTPRWGARPSYDCSTRY